MDTRQQIKDFIEAQITDPHMYQNTALVVRTVLKYIVDNLLNPADDDIDLTQYYSRTEIDTLLEGLVLDGGSIVTASETNGNIRVNGIEIKVYNDSEVLKKQVGGLGNKFLADDNNYYEISFDPIENNAQWHDNITALDKVTDNGDGSRVLTDKGTYVLLPTGNNNTPGTGSGSAIHWVIIPRIVIEGTTVRIVNGAADYPQFPLAPVADWNGENLSYAYNTVIDYDFTKPDDGLVSADLLYVNSERQYGIIEGQRGSSITLPMPTDGQLVAAWLLWGEIDSTVIYPDGLTREELDVILQDFQRRNIIAYNTIPNATAITADYGVSENHKHTVASVTSVSAVNIPDGADLRIKFYNPQGKTLNLAGSGHTNSKGESITTLTLGTGNVTTVLINNVSGALEWSIVGAATEGTGTELNVNPERLLGRAQGANAVAGEPEEIELAAGLYMAGNKINMGFVELGQATPYGKSISPKNSYLRIAAPSTGYLKIEVPIPAAGFILSALKMTIQEHLVPENPDPTPTKLALYTIACRTHVDINDWLPQGAAVAITSHQDRVLPVRLVKVSNTVFHILIGNADTQWSNTVVSVDSIDWAGQQQSLMTMVDKNWLLGISPTYEGTETHVITPASNWGTGTDAPNTSTGEATIEPNSTVLNFTNVDGHYRTVSPMVQTGNVTFTKTGSKPGSTIVQKFTSNGTGSVNASGFTCEVLNQDPDTGFALGDTLPAGTYRLFFNDEGSIVTLNIATVGANSGGGTDPEEPPKLATPGMSTPGGITHNALTLFWGDVANESSYEIQQSLTNGSTGTTIATPAANTTNTPVSGLTPSTLYYFRIRAIGDGTTYSNSDWSQWVSATTLAESGGTTTPVAPTNGIVNDTADTFTFNLGAE